MNRFDFENMSTFFSLFFVVIALIGLASARLTLQPNYKPSTIPIRNGEMLSPQQHAELSHSFIKYRKLKTLLNHEEFLEEGGEATNNVAVVDFSAYFSVDTLSCLRNNGFVSAIPRGYCSYGAVDKNMVQNVANARAAGFEYVDTYFFPCPTCGKSPEAQWDEIWAIFTDYHVNVGMVWIDIEGSEYWSDVNSNINFLTRLINQARAYNAVIGIYANRYQWNNIFGGWELSPSYPLWYPNYDSNPSCSNFQPFGGFTKADLKQYVGDTVQCGAGVDISSFC